MSGKVVNRTFFKYLELISLFQKDLQNLLCSEINKEDIYVPYKVLHLIYLLGIIAKPISVEEIKKKSHQYQDNIFYYLQIGVKKGWITMQNSVQDGRITLSSLNEAGKEIFLLIESFFNKESMKNFEELLDKHYWMLLDLKHKCENYES